MKNIFRVVRRFTTNFFNWMTFVTMMLIVVTVFIQILFRYVIKSPLIWSEEFAKFMFPWLIFSGAALASRINSHIKIDYFADKLPDRLQSILNKIIQIASFLFCMIVIFYTIPLAESQKGMKSTALGIPLNCYTLSIVIGLVGIGIYILSGTTGEDTKGPEK